MRGQWAADAVGLLAGYALDAWLGDPRRLHPVAGFGQAAGALERRLHPADRATRAGGAAGLAARAGGADRTGSAGGRRDERVAGAVFTAVAVGAPVLAGVAAVALTRRRPVARAALVAAGTWAVLGGRTLRAEAGAMNKALRGGDLPAARQRLSHLCGRDPARLDEPELARATVESVAENTSDAVVAPLFWGAVAGLPGLLGYRAVNTLDAMVGHRSPRYARFGTPAARLDDVANLLPSRLTGLLGVAAAPAVHGDRADAWRVWRRDRHDHPSPNAGQCEAAFAGALGVRLGGRNVYFGRSEVRPFLGDGPRPEARHIRRAATLSRTIGLAALAGAAALATVRAAAAGATGRRVRPRLGAAVAGAAVTAGGAVLRRVAGGARQGRVTRGAAVDGGG
ncbi:cobalamin biosynthesis protein [Polymorphospora sp. NPDC051019]|uniref:cobalamin biosynthesis protein n=1 Tax=Polymorphospora sp. NPDC051019 TaxID=3155725 RepID=UPI0034440BC0